VRTVFPFREAMMSHFRIPSAAILLSLLLVGCTTFSALTDNPKKGPKQNTGEKSDHLDDQQEESWVREVGVDARGDRPIEYDTDPLRNLFTSPKARSIERNLGIH